MSRLPKLMGILITEAMFTRTELESDLRSSADDGIPCIRANAPVCMLLQRKQILSLVHQIIDAVPDSYDKDSTEIELGPFEITVYEIDSKLWARSEDV